MKLFYSVREVRQWIEAAFYHHGMFCSSHPFAIISLVISIAFVVCCPLCNLPLPGNAPLTYNEPLHSYSEAAPPPSLQAPASQDKAPRWLTGPPVAYVQQIVVRAAVTPWSTQRLIRTDAFRGPLSTVFTLLNTINNFKIPNTDKTVDDVCLRVSESSVGGDIARLLPRYNCLIVSPASFWNNDRSRFDSDGEIIKNIFRKRTLSLSASASHKDVLFGVGSRESGVKRFYMRNRQRVISYAVTIVMRQYDPQFLVALDRKLAQQFSAHKPGVNVTLQSTRVSTDIVHMYFARHTWIEYSPLIVTYAVLFLYIYFSVRKIEMVKSKWGLAFSAVVMVIASLLMSVSICLFFGLSPSLNGSEIFPYLVMLIGLENVLVVTKSVVSTPVHLDVKLRVAQGISKEGWYIFKHLVTELAIFAIGFLTFVPAIQEFCLLVMVGLLTDFFLQVVFFTTVLSVDIRRMELYDLHRQSVQQGERHPDQAYRHFRPVSPSPLASPDSTTTMGGVGGPAPPPRPVRTSSASVSSPLATRQHRPVMALRIDTGEYLQEMAIAPPSPSGNAGEGTWHAHSPQQLPRRVRLLNLWAHTRVFQKLMMLCMVIWISLIVHKTGVWQHVTKGTFLSNGDLSTHSAAQDFPVTASPESIKPRSDVFNNMDDGKNSPDIGISAKHENENGQATNKAAIQNNLDALERKDTDDSRRIVQGKGDIKVAPMGEGHVQKGQGDWERLLAHEEAESWSRLSHLHWPTLFGYYNITVEGEYISMLPSMRLSVPVSMDTALSLRHPNEPKMVSQLERYYNMAAAHMYDDVTEGEEEEEREEEEEEDVEVEVEDEPVEGAGLPVDDVLIGVERVEEQTRQSSLIYNPTVVDTSTNRTLTWQLVLNNLARVPCTRLEILAHLLLAAMTLLLLGSLVTSLYSCLCPRDYGRWRATWMRGRKHRRASSAAALYRHVRDVLPVPLHGHSQEVECIAVDRPLVVSSCLGGYIKVWESTTGECRTTILRNRRLERETTTSTIGGGDGPISSQPSHTTSQRYTGRRTQHKPRPHSAAEGPDEGPFDSDEEWLERGGGRSAKSKHARYRSVDLGVIRFDDIVPDLHSAIHTDFVAQASEKRAAKALEAAQKKRESLGKEGATWERTGEGCGSERHDIVRSVSCVWSPVSTVENIGPHETSSLSIQSQSSLPHTAAIHTASSSPVLPSLSHPNPSVPSLSHPSPSVPSLSHPSPASGPTPLPSASPNPHPTVQSPHPCPGGPCPGEPTCFTHSHPCVSHQTSVSYENEATGFSPHNSNVSICTAAHTSPQMYRSPTDESTFSASHKSQISGDIQAREASHNNTSTSYNDVTGDMFTFDDVTSGLSSDPLDITPPPSLEIAQSSATTARASRPSSGAGYDFWEWVGADYVEHKQNMAEKAVYMENKRQRGEHSSAASAPYEYEPGLGESPGGDSGLDLGHACLASADAGSEWPAATAPSAVWALECRHDVIVAGCGDGRIEFWDGLTGELKYEHCGSTMGVTQLCFTGKRVLAARLDGSIDFLELEFTTAPLPPPRPPSTGGSVSKPSRVQKRGHRRVPSSHAGELMLQWEDLVGCHLVATARAHQRAVSFMLECGGRLITASHDHTLKVYSTDSCECLFTLYGHTGGVTALSLQLSTDSDSHVNPSGVVTSPAVGGSWMCAVSGGEEGAVRVWDLTSGECVNKLQGHAAPVSCVQASHSHVISSGLDDRLCIWSRPRGALLHWIQLESGFCNSLRLLTNNLLASGAQGCIYLWDVARGEVLRVVELEASSRELQACVSVRQLHVVDPSSLVCDYGSQLRLVRFPHVLEKAE